MTTLYFAYSIATPAVRAFKSFDWALHDMGMLVSFYYIKDFNRHFPNRQKLMPTMLDSGAFSAYNSGKEIDIDKLIEEAKNEFWDETVSLDVIKDAENSLKNALYMKEKGCNAMPVFHIGEPFEILKEYCAEFDRVGLSCRFGETERESLKWLNECYRREYPKKFHSFGWVAEKMLLEFPFYTADSSSWALAPQAYKRWRAYGGRVFIKNTKDISLLPEMDFYSNIQKRVRHKWAKELKKLNGLQSIRQ